ncbi:MAG: hypothetical protein ACOH2R_18755 [Pseudomonas sp.]
MAMQNDVSALFPVSFKSNTVSTTGDSVGSTRNSNVGKSFAETLKGVTTDNSTTEPARSARTAERYEWLMQAANADPEKADMLAHLYAYNSLDGPLLDATDLPILRLKATGEIYTSEMRHYYSQVRNAMQVDRSALYESEMAKGTPTVQILDKVLAYNDTLPAEFRRIAEW